MHAYYDVIINGVSLHSNGIYPVKRPSFSAPEKKYITHDILGADGSLYIDTGNYGDVNLDIDFNYMVTDTLWMEAFRKAKRLILCAKELRLSDDQNVYYKVKRVEIGQNQRSTKRIGKFTATFTLDPYAYFVRGKFPVPVVNNQVYNPFDTSLPLYKITGSRTGYLVVNGNRMTVPGSVIIDVTNKCAYDGEGNSMSTQVSGRYDDLALVYGTNTIQTSSYLTLEVIPNWRQI